MNFEKSEDGRVLKVELAGEIDSLNAGELEEKLMREVKGVTDLTFDLAELEYISSAGLRILLSMQKLMKHQGNMEIKNTNDEVMQIFKVTGFVRLLNIV